MAEQVTPFQRLASAASTCGHTFRMRFLDEITNVLIEDEKVAATFTCYRVKERGTGFWVHQKGMRLVVSVKVDNTWQAPQSVTVWDTDPDFVPFEIDTHVGKTPQEFTQRRNWENEAYRWGNDSRLGQRDSYVRSLETV
jgi:hypothetical protein